MYTLWQRMRFWLWDRRVRQMKSCNSLDEIRRRFGDPHHFDDAGDMVFWHYPLGVIDTMLYSIHVAVINERPEQVYLHMEPTKG